MKRYTIQFGTCESSDGTKEKLYVTQPDLYIDEFNKQKASFKNPNATDESIKRIAERVVDSRVVCKLGEYEDIDESPEHLAKVKQAFDIIKEKQVDVRMFIIYDLENYNRLQKNDYCKLTKAEDDLLKEVLIND